MGLRSNVWPKLKTYPDLVARSAPFSATIASEWACPWGAPRQMDDFESGDHGGAAGANRTTPYISRQISFAFGSEIAVPSTDERGLLLTNALATDYWLPKPYLTTNGSDTAQGFYWSPNAQKVFAIQSGPITVTWIKAVGYSLANVPAYTNENGSVSFQTNGGTVYQLYTADYLVLGVRRNHLKGCTDGEAVRTQGSLSSCLKAAWQP